MILGADQKECVRSCLSQFFCKALHPNNCQIFLSRTPRETLGTLSIDNEMHDDNLRNPRRIGSRVSSLVGKRKVKQCVVLRRRRVLVFRLVALAMAFKNVRNLLLINHNDGFINDDEFVVLYDLFVSKNLDFPYDPYVPRFDPEELDESESFAEFHFGK